MCYAGESGVARYDTQVNQVCSDSPGYEHSEQYRCALGAQVNQVCTRYDMQLNLVCTTYDVHYAGAGESGVH